MGNTREILESLMNNGARFNDEALAMNILNFHFNKKNTCEMDLEKTRLISLIDKIPRWSREKSLLPKNPEEYKMKMAFQLLKTVEELGETAAAFLRGKDLDFEDGLGDIVFTVLVECAQKGINPYKLFANVFEEVLDRKGEHNGVSFVKASEIEDEDVMEHEEITYKDLKSIDRSNEKESFSQDEKMLSMEANEFHSIANQVRHRLSKGNVYARLKGSDEFDFIVHSINTQEKSFVISGNKEGESQLFLCDYNAISDFTNI